MYNPWNMNGGYYPPQQQMQPPPQPQWMASAQAQIPKAQAAANQQARLQERIGTLQEQYKGAGTEQQAGMQQRIDEMQAKLKAQQGTATGAQRENYGWRQERRQAKNAMAAGNDPTMAPQPKQPNAVQGGGMWQTQGPMSFGGNTGWAGPWGANTGGYNNPYATMNGGTREQMAGMGPWGMQGGQYNPQPLGRQPNGQPYTPEGGMGGDPRLNPMNFGGGYNQSMGGNQTGLAEHRQARQGEMARTSAPNPGPQPQGGAPSWYEAGSFDTPFGNLVQSSVGNGNIYKQNGSDGQSLYHYDPAQGWKHMTQQEYMGYNNPADFYQDPNQYAAAAGGNKSQMQMRNGMYQTMLGTGTYR